MIEGRSIICVASNWRDPPTSKHHVMRILAKRNRVLWINYHASRRPTLTRGDARKIGLRLRQALRGAEQTDCGVRVASPLLLPLPHSPAARRFNGLILRRLVQRFVREASDPAQLWLFTPDVPEIIEATPFERVVYYCVDEFSAFTGYEAGQVERMERRVLAGADVVLATSRPLLDDRRQRHSNVHFLPHGVDVAHFAAAERATPPADLADAPRPTFGYFGLISDYVDIQLLAGVAVARPDWSFVLIGDADCDVSRLRACPNVRLLGRRPYADLPAYCAAFDAGLIPFRMNRLTRAVNPIKLREYLAAGLPVISSPLPETLGYSPHVYPAETVAEFINVGERALAANSAGDRAARRRLVEADSWESRVEEISRYVMGRVEAGPARRADQPTPVDGNPSPTLNALSVDVEEYFHAEAFAGLPAATRAGLPCRAAPRLERIAELLAGAGSRATFFVLGEMVGPHKRLLRELASRGHEIACHGDGHAHLRRLDPRSFRADLRQAAARIADVIGSPPRGYRAPTFSITRQTAWAVDILCDEGFEYDSSIYPIRHDRYGVPDAPTSPFRLLARDGRSLMEFPPLTLRLGRARIPLGGGGYLRLLPASAIAAAVQARQCAGAPVMLYIHPWELDTEQPRLPIAALANWRHRVNLATTERKLRLLLERFSFDTAENVLGRVRRTCPDWPEFQLAPDADLLQIA